MEIKNYPWYPSVHYTGATVRMGDQAQDRNPQQGGQERDQAPRENPYSKRPLSDDEFDKAIKILSSMKTYVSANLTHRVEKNAEGKRVVVILDPQHNIIKTLTESELGTAFLLEDRTENERGSLVNKKI